MPEPWLQACFPPSQPVPPLQLPPLQLSPEGHGLLQPPQAAGFDDVSTHSLPHRVRPGRHTHLPELHVCAESHFEPHAPQFDGSRWGSMHSAPQLAIAPKQPHTPLVQVEKAAPQSSAVKQETQVLLAGSQMAFGFVHSESFWQPTMQVLRIESQMPLGQSPGSRQPTQACVTGSQNGAPEFEQLPFARQPTHF